MPFIQSCSAQQLCKPEGYHDLCVQYVALSCCLSAKQMAKSKQCKVPTKEGHRLDHATKLEASLPRQWPDVICIEIVVHQRLELPQHSCKPLCSSFADLIAPEIEMSQRCALRQHSFMPLCPDIADPIAAEIEVSQRCALLQHSSEKLCPGRADIISKEIEVSQRCTSSLVISTLRAVE
jgi:hypothetical protein